MRESLWPKEAISLYQAVHHYLIVFSFRQTDQERILKLKSKTLPTLSEGYTVAL